MKSLPQSPSVRNDAMRAEGNRGGPCRDPAALAHTGNNSVSDAEMLAHIAAGDLAHFEAFVARYRPRLLRFIGARIADAHRTEDLTQDVFLRIFRAARATGNTRRYDGRASVATWVFTIAVNCLTDHFRASGRRPLTLAGNGAFALGANTPDPSLGPEDRAVMGEDAARAQQLLAILPEEQRQALALRVLGGLAFTEIAEITGVPVTTVKARVTYGLNKVRQAMTASGRSL